MEKSKKTLKMLGICIIGLVIVVAVNMLRKPEDPFGNPKDVGFRYQHIEEKNLLNNPQSDSYFVYFYEVGNKKCEKANEDLKKEMTIISNVYYFNIEDTTLKRGKDFDYKNVTDYEDITIKQVPMMIHVEDKKIDHVYYKASDIKKALE
ncbi:hypothetical protein DWW38_00800 [Coprobacillus sp. AF15-30]|nr:hypothetical protein DWW38_00800 [Coprobacillus sp. AF15-30]